MGIADVRVSVVLPGGEAPLWMKSGSCCGGRISPDEIECVRVRPEEIGPARVISGKDLVVRAIRASMLAEDGV